MNPWRGAWREFRGWLALIILESAIEVMPQPEKIELCRALMPCLKRAIRREPGGMRSEAEVRKALWRVSEGWKVMVAVKDDDRFIATQAAVADALGWVLGAVNSTLGLMLEEAKAKDAAARQRQVK